MWDNRHDLEDEAWPADAAAVSEPLDDARMLRGAVVSEREGQGPVDYAEAVTARDAAWWAALSDYESTYGLLRALESAAQRGAPLHLARCIHHLDSLLSGVDADDRAWLVALLQRIREMLARRSGSAVTAESETALFSYLAAVQADPRFTPPPVLPTGLIHQLYPHSVSPAQLLEALDRGRYPMGKPLPPCLLCESE